MYAKKTLSVRRFSKVSMNKMPIANTMTVDIVTLYGL